MLALLLMNALTVAWSSGNDSEGLISKPGSHEHMHRLNVPCVSSPSNGVSREPPFMDGVVSATHPVEKTRLGVYWRTRSQRERGLPDNGIDMVACYELHRPHR